MQSFNIKFNQVYGWIFIRCILISTESHFYVIGSWLGELFAKPRRIIESTACASPRATTSIPKWVTWCVERIYSPVCRNPSFTKVIVSHKAWYVLLHLAIGTCTGTYVSVAVIAICLLKAICKAPNVLARAWSMSDAHTFKVCMINAVVVASRIGCVESTWTSILIANNSPTHFAVGYSLSFKDHWLAPTCI